MRLAPLDCTCQQSSSSAGPRSRTTGRVSIHDLCIQEQRRYIDLQPEYQRDFERELPACSKFVEIVLLGLPFQEVWLHQVSPERQEVVDGQQRLTTIKAFREGKLPNHQRFKLQVMQSSSWRNFSSGCVLLPHPLSACIFGEICQIE